MAAMGDATLNVPKLNGRNYSVWKFNMKLLLLEKDLWSTVEPGEERPDETKLTELMQYSSRQGKALAKICLNLEPEQQQHVMHLSCPKDVWVELEKLYAPKDSKYRIVQLRRSLYCQKFHSKDSMDAYLGKFSHLMNELAIIGDKIDDADLAMVILCGLDESYENVVSTICNLSEKEFNVASVRHRLLAEYERRNSFSENTKRDVKVLATNNKSETSRRNDSTPENKKSKVCFKCGKRGHYARNCWSGVRSKLKKTHPDQRGNFNERHNLSVSCSVANNNVVSNTWVIDSGATHHMTPNEDYFQNVRAPKTLTNVVLADGQEVPCKGIGQVTARVIEPGGILESFNAENALFVPDLKHSVLSVRQMTENNKTVIFNKNGCSILSRNEILLKGRKQNNLFVVDTFNPCNNIEVNNALRFNDDNLNLKIWHKRFMHVNMGTLVKMMEMNVVKGLKFQNEKTEVCEDCLLGKSTIQPFLKTNYKNREKTKPMDLVHTDLMGPIIESWGKSRYMLTIIDDASRYVFVYFLKNKSETLDTFNEWLNMAENQTQRTLKRVRSDNGLEFCSNEWDKFCKARGIIHETTMVYTPQQNGVAERMNRTLMDLVRSTLNSSGLPDSAWAELTKTAACIRNRVTNKHDEKHTPYELWVGKQPSVRYLRTPGCVVFVHTPKPKQRSKLSLRAEKGILIGYADRGRGWRIWMPDTRKIIESRDCVFREGTTFYDKRTVETFVPYRQNQDSNDEDECTNESQNVVYHKCNDNGTILQHDTFQENSSSNTGQELEHDVNVHDNRTLDNPIFDKSKRKSCKEKKVPETSLHPMTLRNRNRTKDEATSSSGQINKVEQTAKDSNEVPSSYEEAIRSTEADKWLEAIEEEMEALEEHNVYSLEKLPKETKPVKSRWVFQRKMNESGEITRYKARLVAKGFTQCKGLDYDEAYAPVSSFETLRLLTALSVEENWYVDQYDVKNAYLYAPLSETVYMEPPEGYDKRGNLYWKLHKAIYGLKQSGRCWNDCLDKKLKEQGFKRNPADPCVYQLNLKEGRVILAIYVDDIFAMSENEIVRQKCKKILSELFEIKCSESISYLLGVKFTRNKDGSFTLTQKAYIDRLLERFRLEDGRDLATPMEVGLDFLGESDEKCENEYPFRELIGGLLYLSQRTRPDISYAVGRLSQYCSKCTTEHWKAAKRILRYLKSTKNLGITYQKRQEPLIVYTDADWATCKEDRKSTSGYVVMLAGAPILWRSTKQATTALSSMEAEYIALFEGVRSVTWIREMLSQMNFARYCSRPTEIRCDSQSAIAHAKNSIDKSKTKHIAIKYHYVREKIADGTVLLKYVPTQANTADIFTKPLGARLHDIHRSTLMN